MALGLLLHRAFAWLADSQTVQELLKTSDELSIAHLATLYEPKVHRWANDYASVDLSSAELGNNAIAQLQTTLAHAQGRWILSAGQHAHSEWALTGVFNGETSNIVIDRTFIEKDRRWIIDYKTGRPGPEETLQTFLAREVSRYMAQLKKYKIVCNALDPRPITTALYFTALGHLEIVDDD